MRLRSEMTLIFGLGTVQPHGLNINTPIQEETGSCMEARPKGPLRPKTIKFL